MKKNNAKTLLKVRFYIISLWLLFFLVAICTMEIPSFVESQTIKQKIILVLCENILPIISIILCIVCFVLMLVTRYEWEGASNPAYKIKEIKNENYEYLTFLTTCIIPLICIDFDDFRNVIVFIILIFMIGIIFIKMDLYYGNPTLAIMGYKLYRVEIENVNAPNGIILITKDNLHKGKSIKWMKIDEYVWVAKEIN